MKLKTPIEESDRCADNNRSVSFNREVIVDETRAATIGSSFSATMLQSSAQKKLNIKLVKSESHHEDKYDTSDNRVRFIFWTQKSYCGRARDNGFHAFIDKLIVNYVLFETIMQRRSKLIKMSVQAMCRVNVVTYHFKLSMITLIYPTKATYDATLHIPLRSFKLRPCTYVVGTS